MISIAKLKYRLNQNIKILFKHLQDFLSLILKIIKQDFFILWIIMIFFLTTIFGVHFYFRFHNPIQEDNNYVLDTSFDYIKLSQMKYLDLYNSIKNGVTFSFDLSKKN